MDGNHTEKEICHVRLAPHCHHKQQKRNTRNTKNNLYAYYSYGGIYDAAVHTLRTYALCMSL